MSQEVASPEVIPVLTKTDARELKSLVRRDTEILTQDLDYRKNEIEQQLNAEFNERQREIEEERQRRAEVDQEEAQKAMDSILKRVSKLNDLIVEHMQEMSEAGWTVSRYGGSLDPHSFTVKMPSFANLRPPTRSDEDLDEQATELNRERQEIMDRFRSDYQTAKRSLEVEEARMLRQLTLDSITTEAAREFVLDMPTVEDLLPMPPQIEASVD